MHRWSYSYRGTLIGYLLLSGGCAAVPSCPLPSDTVQLPAAAVQPMIPESIPPPFASPMTPATLALEHKVKLQEKRIPNSLPNFAC